MRAGADREALTELRHALDIDVPVAKQPGALHLPQIIDREADLRRVEGTAVLQVIHDRKYRRLLMLVCLGIADPLVKFVHALLSFCAVVWNCLRFVCACSAAIMWLDCVCAASADGT